MKLVSVIIPIYQAEKYIAAAVQSVLNQTYQHFEILIIDDGSCDRSYEICQQFVDSRIKIIRQENQGVSAARNRGIEAATGEFLAFLDGDDLWYPEKLFTHVRYLENSPQVGISFSRFSYIDEIGKSLAIFKLSQIENITPALILARNPVGNPSCVVMRKNIFQASNLTCQNSDLSVPHVFFDPELLGFEDVECWLRIALTTNWKIVGIPEVLTFYRVHPQGISSDFNKQLNSLALMLAKTGSYAPELIAKYAKVVKAYTFRKGSQRAIRQREKSNALKMIFKALSIYPQIVNEEPLRTLFIFGAACCLYLLPKSVYSILEKIAFKLAGSLQKFIYLSRKTNVSHEFNKPFADNKISDNTS